MSLFQFGFARKRSASPDREPEDDRFPPHFPKQRESGLGKEEYRAVGNAVVDLSDPNRPKEPVRRKRGKYATYTEQDRAKIGKYTAEIGNELAHPKFVEAFSNLKESSVRNFKKLYLYKLDAKRNEQSITSLALKARGRPPILGDLADKLVNVLLAIRWNGGTINCHVVRATATALLKLNPSQAARLCTFDMPRSWIISIYKRIGFVRIAGTTSRPPVPMGVYQECRLDFLNGI